jgi:phospholipid/cholesterol/gamma-HCH transport system substrate-binding protein
MSDNHINREQALELKAGIFVLIGLVFIAMMAFKFGRLGQGLFQQYYSLTVTFPSADGLIKNSDVQLAGARIGYVAEKPVITTGGSGVTLPLKILSNVKIPRETTFEVSSSGLLGDKFVDISPTKEFDPKKFDASDPHEVLEPGETVEGASAGVSLGELQSKGADVFEELKVEIQKLTVVTDKINTGILSTENQKNIAETLANLKGTSQHFSVASQDLDGVVLNAKGAVDSAKQTLGTVNAAAADVHTAIDDAKTTLAAVRELLARAQTGNGPIATLLNDPHLSQDLKVFVANLREHGVLFYKNKEPAAAPTPALRRQY